MTTLTPQQRQAILEQCNAEVGKSNILEGEADAGKWKESAFIRNRSTHAFVLRGIEKSDRYDNLMDEAIAQLAEKNGINIDTALSSDQKLKLELDSLKEQVKNLSEGKPLTEKRGPGRPPGKATAIPPVDE